MLNVLLSFLFELLEFSVVLKGGLLKISGFDVESSFEFVDFATVDFFHSHEFAFESFVLNNDILILVEEVVDFEFELTDGYIFSAELIFEFDEFVFEFDSHFALIVKIILILFLGLFELFSLVFEHELNFVVALVIVGVV